MQKNFKKLIRLLIVESEQTQKLNTGYLGVTPEEISLQDPFVERKKQMEEIAKETARALSLSGLRFISRSSRLNGAYTYSAINERNENVVLKIQPIDEIDGYRKVQQIASRLSPDVAIHLPTIYQIRPLQALLHGPAAARLTGLDGLCAIVMERLEELPGNLFQLITKPPKKSSQSLNALLNDREAFDKAISDVVDHRSYTIVSILNRHSIHKDIDTDAALAKLKRQIGRAIYSSASREQIDATANIGSGLLGQVREEVRLWCLGVGISNQAPQTNIAKYISDSLETALSRRAIPQEPKEEKAGPLGSVKGIDKLMRAIKKLGALGIEPSDLHGNNIMLRPDSGELVIADLGHFG